MLLGIEIGGTKLQIGLGEGHGTLAGLWRGSIDPARGPEGIRQQIIEAVPQLLTETGQSAQSLEAASVGFGGPVDDPTQTVIKSHQIAGWDNFPLASWIGDFLHLPAFLFNDSDAAGLAEAVCGAGKGLSPVYYMNIGSGIGGGFVVDGKVYRGTGRGAAETGHLRIATWTRSGLVYETLEHLASGWAIERRARSSSEKRSPSLRGTDDTPLEPSNLTVAQIGKAALAGNSFARELLDPSWDALAEALCQVVALLCPRRIVIGGGVALLGEEILFAPLRERVRRRVFEPFADCFDIVPAALGEEVVVHGTLIWARQRLAERAGRP
jgi:glucokinase